MTTAYVAPTQVVLGEAVDPDSRVIAWRPKNTLHEPEQVALDASAERKELLLGPAIDVCALAMDAADSIGAQDSLEKMLGHQLALAHKSSFEFANRAVDQRDPAAGPAPTRHHPSFPSDLAHRDVLRCPDDATGAVDSLSFDRDFARLAGSPAFFARKFDATVDARILERVRRGLVRQGA